MKPDRAYLEHILHCIRRIAEDSAGGKDVVFSSPTFQDAIIRNLQVLCESAQRLSRASKQTHPGVDWRAIAGLRNVLVHDYFEVDLEVVWGILQRDLPGLERAARQLLRDLDAKKAIKPREHAVETLADAEAGQIRKVLAAAGGNKSRAAQILGIERKTLYRKLERMKL